MNVYRKEPSSGSTKVWDACSVAKLYLTLLWDAQRGRYHLPLFFRGCPASGSGNVPGYSRKWTRRLLLGQEKARECIYWGGGQNDKLGLIDFCPAFPHLGHLDRIPSSPAVLVSRWLKTSSLYHPPTVTSQSCLSLPQRAHGFPCLRKIPHLKGILGARSGVG